MSAFYSNELEIHSVDSELSGSSLDVAASSYGLVAGRTDSKIMASQLTTFNEPAALTEVAANLESNLAASVAHTAYRQTDLNADELTGVRW